MEQCDSPYFTNEEGKGGTEKKLSLAVGCLGSWWECQHLSLDLRNQRLASWPLDRSSRKPFSMQKLLKGCTENDGMGEERTLLTRLFAWSSLGIVGAEKNGVPYSQWVNRLQSFFFLCRVLKYYVYQTVAALISKPPCSPRLSAFQSEGAKITSGTAVPFVTP